MHIMCHSGEAQKAGPEGAYCNALSGLLGLFDRIVQISINLMGIGSIRMACWANPVGSR